MACKVRFVIEMDGNMVEKGEKADYQVFPFQKYFQKTFIQGH